MFISIAFTPIDHNEAVGGGGVLGLYFKNSSEANS